MSEMNGTDRWFPLLPTEGCKKPKGEIQLRCSTTLQLDTINTTVAAGAGATAALRAPTPAAPALEAAATIDEPVQIQPDLDLDSAASPSKMNEEYENLAAVLAESSPVDGGFDMEAALA